MYLNLLSFLCTICFIINDKRYSTYNKLLLEVNILQTKKLTLNYSLIINKAYFSYIKHDINLRLILFILLNEQLSEIISWR